jgi:hypothetical protein
VSDKTNRRELHSKVFELARARNFAALTILLPDGHPQTQVMWVDADGDHLLVNSIRPPRQPTTSLPQERRPELGWLARHAPLCFWIASAAR